MRIEFTYSVFHRILDLKTGVYFYTAPFFFTITFLYDMYKPLPFLLLKLLLEKAELTFILLN